MKNRKKLLSIFPWCLFGFSLVLFGCPDPCAQDPCADIQNAVPESCSRVGELGFECDCESGYAWDEESYLCWDMDPCEPDPCADIQNAVPESCIESGNYGFICDCETGYNWDDDTNTCEEINPCDPDPCVSIQGAIPDTCSKEGYDDFTCECETDLFWNDGSNICEETVLGQFCGDCYGTFCQKSGTNICPGSDLDMPCIGTATGMYCSQSCSNDDDCLNPYIAMKCLKNCSKYPEVEDRCWEANSAVWMETEVCQ